MLCYVGITFGVGECCTCRKKCRMMWCNERDLYFLACSIPCAEDHSNFIKKLQDDRKTHVP